ncbi:Protein kinase-like (PK-like) [Venustampulla echinocandica]|uniref:Protein kinase-like (PK-like) n=1 Tax=Venustampulla echinocandica TaxID=2656787 RepID=A0A370TPM6_9HELO|nr:Protein kinase-like (PK-like) [Venustampulla echinocandica]RDL37474.1 Protein kinase-like (PK-like) [Venustampulla echinocandica]
MSYSTGGGGTLTLPSPTHVHHVDVTSAVRSLRRSLSRSPSKFNLVTKSPSSSPKSPLSPSPRSPSKRASTGSHLSFFTSASSNSPYTPSPLAVPFPAVPFPPSAKLALRSSGRSKAASPRPSSRTRTSPKSPMRRVLSNSSDSGNAASPTLSSWVTTGQENSRSTSPAERKNLEKPSRMSLNLDATAPINHALSRLGDGSSDSPLGPSTSSPLKRSDTIMNLDQASLGSPVAKRRSLHGSASFGHDFNVFDHGPTSAAQFDIHDESNHEYELSAASLAPENASLTSMPRRSSSLRKSTLQQRHGEKTSWGRRHAAQVLAAQQLAAQSGSEVSTPNPVKNRPRLSLDQFMPPMARDSPFSSQGSLPHPSMHVVNPPTHQPHPLSRTMTTSSSNSSMVDESPTHVPVHFGEHPRPKLDFSKSLPVGSLNPFAPKASRGEESGSFSTPQNYKSVKPLPAAFMSTGLVSKVNRNPEDEPTRGLGKGIVPDTPCKKQVNIFATYPPNIPGSAASKGRHIRPSFGNPSTPFNPHGAPGNSSIFGKGSGVFGGPYSRNSLSRRGSFLSNDGDDNGGSPDAKGEDRSSSDFDFPPTPTKQALVPGLTPQPGDGSPSSHRSISVSASASGYGLARKLVRTRSKLSLFTTPIEKEDDHSDTEMDMDDSPTPMDSKRDSKIFMSMPLSSISLPTRRPTPIHSPTPLKAKSLTISFLAPRRPGFAKISHVAPASSLERIGFVDRLSPSTPKDSLLPPDPSGLSISNPKNGQIQKSARASSASMFPPATPTTGRESFLPICDRRLSMTPLGNLSTATEMDKSLASRFEKAELIGTGEFSHVYRVTQPAPRILRASQSVYFGASRSPFQGRSPQTPMPERVFAVKKSRQPYQGTRDRERKLQEVSVLKSLGQTDHVVHLIDSWEDNSYLYIQTEFCEEGGLDMFLSQVGRKGRLDDFRIWKIVLELGLGLRHIHDSGFIHLDLKPANILITFEGVLKIADFGMAATWPAQPGIEGEGDREYIGPEILLGQYDKPADIFALGLIMLEIAGNVQLPDNGPTWQRLRSGDMSDVPSLTFSNGSAILRDATGIPIQDSDNSMGFSSSDDEIEANFGSPTMISRKRNCDTSVKSLSHDAGNLFGSGRRGELHQPPQFMTDMYHDHALDRLVRCMILPNPQDRPTVHQVLESQGVQWVASRRRAGATVFEGNWGPADDVLVDDAEMMDV